MTYYSISIQVDTFGKLDEFPAVEFCVGYSKSWAIQKAQIFFVSALQGFHDNNVIVNILQQVSTDRKYEKNTS